MRVAAPSDTGPVVAPRIAAAADAPPLASAGSLDAPAPTEPPQSAPAEPEAASDAGLAPAVEETADHPPMAAANRPADPVPATDDVFSTIEQSRAALARGLASIGDEVASFTRHSVDAGTQAAIEMLGAKTWADAFAVNTGLARTTLDHWIDSTAKVSELGLKLAIDWSRPLTEGWGKV